MTELSRKEKIRLLKIKNKRKSIIDDFGKKNINITLESFCDVDYSINLMEKLFIKIDRDIEEKDEFKFQHNKTVVLEQLKKIKSVLCRFIVPSKLQGNRCYKYYS